MATASPKVPLSPPLNNRTKRKISFAEIEDAQYKGYRTLVSPDPTKLSVEYLSNLSPKSLRKVPPYAFPKTKGITLAESKLPPYNKLERYVKPKAREDIRIEDVWLN